MTYLKHKRQKKTEGKDGVTFWVWVSDLILEWSVVIKGYKLVALWETLAFDRDLWAVEDQRSKSLRNLKHHQNWTRSSLAH